MREEGVNADLRFKITNYLEYLFKVKYEINLNFYFM